MKRVFAIVVLLSLLILLVPIDLVLRLALIGLVIVIAVMLCFRIGKDMTASSSGDVEVYTPEVEEPRVFLRELPIETIEGIGEVYGRKLSAEGITTVQDLLETEPERIAEICDVGADKVEKWVAMARFAWLEGVSEEDAEAIVLGTDIKEIIDLANADPNEVLEQVKSAVERGDVRVPAGYQFTLDMVKKWIESARRVTSE